MDCAGALGILLASTGAQHRRMTNMQRTTSPDGTTVSYDKYGSGPPLVLVHGGFSDHITNWQECKSLLAELFTVYAIARRGRGETTATEGHSVVDEARDVVAVLQAVGEPAFLLGHSYGAACAVNAAALYPDGVRKLVLYEHPGAEALTADTVSTLESFEASEDWDGMVEAFMGILQVPPEEITEIKATPFWNVWTVDAKATLNDLRALTRHDFGAERFSSLTMPVQLLIGSDSPRELYLTDALAAVLPDARIAVLEGTAHEGMTMVPEQFVEKVSEFLLGIPVTSASR
jgi:pimeloyl-ACP methyl ester carboxylesterase